jgi:vitamin B12 transporter
MIKPAFTAFLLACCCAVAANESKQKNAIEHISIYANRTAIPEQDVLASVTVLDRDDIVAYQAADLPALLAQLPGINVSRDGGRGQTSGIYIRGGNTGHTLLLIDGVRSGSATLGYKSLAMLPLELIERIEVVRGPRAAWYGSDALAGVIAITTRRSNAVALTANLGSYGQAGTDVSVSKRIDQLTLSANAGISRSDGFNVREDLDADRDGYNQKFVKVASDYQTELGRWTAQADVNSGYYEFDTSFGSENAADTLNRAYLLGWRRELGQWQHQAQLSRTLDREVSFGPDSSSPFVTERDEFNYQAAADITSAWHFLAGVNWYQEQVDRSATAYEVTSRINRAVFTGLHYQYNAWQLEAALRRDLMNQYGSQNTWQLGAGYQLASHWRLRASRGTAFKTPSFNELYYPGYANPQLQPQESVADELALIYQHSDTTVQLAWFDRNITNLIQGVEQAQNVLLATISGLEFSLQQQWQQFSASLAYTWLDTKNHSTGLMLERRPENTINWRVSYTADTWSWFVTTDYQSSTYQGIYASVANLGGFTLWGVGSSYQMTPQLTIRAKLENLFDKHYQTSAGYATAGANFAISLSYTPQL